MGTDRSQTYRAGGAFAVVKNLSHLEAKVVAPGPSRGTRSCCVCLLLSSQLHQQGPKPTLQAWPSIRKGRCSPSPKHRSQERVREEKGSQK